MKASLQSLANGVEYVLLFFVLVVHTIRSGGRGTQIVSSITCSKFNICLHYYPASAEAANLQSS